MAVHYGRHLTFKSCGVLIFLTGMMGSGKTTVGNLLAEELGLPFFDTDDIISSIAGMEVSTIFEKHGENHFRDLETLLIKNWKLTHGVIATGGGLPCHDGLMETLNAKGKTVYLDCPVHVLVERVDGRAGRPLLAGLQPDDVRLKLEQLSQTRRPLYLTAGIVINANQSPVEVMKNIMRELYT